MRALIVDDSQAMRTILARILRELGFDTIQAADGREALERLSTPPAPELALVDWNMPIMSGIEFVRSARGDGRFDALRILMVSTESEAIRIGEALDAGADEYITKPFDAGAVAQKLSLLGLNPG